MPSKSEQQRKWIFTQRSKYKSKENTPDNMKWIWEKSWKIIEKKGEKMYKRIFKEDLKESRLIPNESKNLFANKMFSSYLTKLNVGDIVWLQDTTSDYQGYYLVIGTQNRKQFKSLGSVVSSSIFKKYGVIEDEVPVFNLK